MYDPSVAYRRVTVEQLHAFSQCIERILCFQLNPIGMSDLASSRFPEGFPPLEEDVYTGSVLRAAPTWETMEAIVDEIIAAIPGNRTEEGIWPHPYGVVVAYPRLGNDVLSFLARQAPLLAYFPDPQTLNKFQENVLSIIEDPEYLTDPKAYRLLDSTFTGVPSRRTWVLYLDKVVAPLRLEEWIPVSRNAIAAAVRSKEPTSTFNDPNWQRMETKQMSDGSYLTIYLNRPLLTSLNRNPEPPIKDLTSLTTRILFPNRLPRQPEPELAATEVKVERKVYDYLSLPKLKLPEGEAPPKVRGTTASYRDGSWERGLMKYIQWLLSPVAEGELLQSLTSDDKVPVWKQAFTHYSYDPENNYEMLEYEGDRHLGSAFTEYVSNNWKRLSKTESELTPGIMTHVYHMYMGGRAHADYSRQLGLWDWVRVGPNEEFKKGQDLFESFMGALYKVGNMLDQEVKSTGYVLVSLLVAYIFTDLVLDPDLQFGAPRNQVTDVFMKLEWGSPVVRVSTQPGGNVRVEVSIPTSGLRKIPKGITLPGTLGVGVAKSQQEADFDAWVDAYQKLRQAGLTREYVAKLKMELDFDTPELKAELPSLHTAFQSLRYHTPYFEGITRRGLQYVAVLNALQANNRVVKVSEGIGRTVTEAKLQAVRNAIASSGR